MATKKLANLLHFFYIPIYLHTSFKRECKNSMRVWLKIKYMIKYWEMGDFINIQNYFIFLVKLLLVHFSNFQFILWNKPMESIKKKLLIHKVRKGLRHKKNLKVFTIKLNKYMIKNKYKPWLLLIRLIIIMI
jgi:hypothetical protein